MYKVSVIKTLLSGWEWTLNHRYELLGSLKDSDLKFTPTGSSKFQDIQYQFACIGSTQLAYTKMLREGRWSNKYFGAFKERLRGVYEVKALEKILKEADEKFKNAIMKFSGEDVFDWGDYKAPVYSVVVILQEHERLHHGQLITYFTLAGLEFPKNFKRDWHL